VNTLTRALAILAVGLPLAGCYTAKVYVKTRFNLLTWVASGLTAGIVTPIVVKVDCLR
jgi:hypothetical protein